MFQGVAAGERPVVEGRGVPVLPNDFVFLLNLACKMSRTAL